METIVDERNDAIRVGMRDHLETRGLSLAKAARGIGMSTTAVSSWLRGDYHGDNDRVRNLVERWLDTERHLKGERTRGPARHAELGVTLTVQTLAAHAQANADLVLVYGAAGSGKTHALKRFCFERSGAFYVEMSPEVTTVARVLDRIAEALELRGSTATGANLVRLLVECLTDRDALLVVDEAHHLSAVLLDMVRSVYDRAGCGLLLAGNDPLWNRLATGERSAQLVSRIGIRRRFRRPSKADALLLAETLIQRSLQDKGSKAVLTAARGVGGLRAVEKLVAQAVVFATLAGSASVRDEDLAKAAAHMGSGL